MVEFVDNMPEGTIGLAGKGVVTAADRERTLPPPMAGRPASDDHAGLSLLFGPGLDDLGATPLRGDVRLDQARARRASRLSGQRLVYTSGSALR